MSPVLENKSNKAIRNLFGCRNEKVDQIKKGTASRKPRKLKISKPIKTMIHTFYDRSDISRVTPCKTSVKNESFLSYMRMTYRKAYKQFKEENPTIEIGYTMFYRCRPNYIRHVGLTPLNACQCVFCANINRKLDVLKLPKLR